MNNTVVTRISWKPNKYSEARARTILAKALTHNAVPIKYIDVNGYEWVAFHFDNPVDHTAYVLKHGK